MILTEAGEVGLQCASLPQVVLRPSLAAMARIGEPQEIVAIAYRVFSGTATMVDVLSTLWACCDEDISEYTGYMGEHGYVAGEMPPEEAGIICAHLLMHGLIGKTDKQRQPQGANQSANDTFVAADYAALAIAHLGMSERDAWGTTMTTLINALHSKFPEINKQQPGSNAPSLAELDADMAELDRINKLRGG